MCVGRENVCFVCHVCVETENIRETKGACVYVFVCLRDLSICVCVRVQQGDEKIVAKGYLRVRMSV